MRRSFAALLVAACLAPAVPAAAAPSTPARPRTTSAAASTVPDRVTTSTGPLGEVSDDVERLVVELDELPSLPAGSVVHLDPVLAEGFGRATVDVPAEDADEVEGEPVRIYRTAGRVRPNDPAVTAQQRRVLDDSRLFEAWAHTTGAADVVIAVLDTGVDGGHPDLAEKLLPGYDAVARRPGGNVDVNGHGTHVAGIAAAAANNATGIAGACWRCRILPVRVLDDAGYGTDVDIAAGIKWAVDRGAHVINLSLGGPHTTSTLEAGVAYAVSRGRIVVAAAGNESIDASHYHPANSPGVLSVAATSADDPTRRAVYSNFGPTIDLAAPGSHYSTYPTAKIAAGYATLQGTSMATPQVAGVAGLARALDPGLSGAAFTDAAVATAVPVEVPLRAGSGRLDAAALLTRVAGAAPTPSDAPVATADHAYAWLGNTTSIRLLDNDRAGAGDTLDRRSVDLRGTSHGQRRLDDGILAYTPRSWQALGRYHLDYEVCAVTSRRCASAPVTVEVITPPTFQANADTATVVGGTTVTLDVLANDTPHPTHPIDPSTVTIATAPAHGTVSVGGGRVRYTAGSTAGEDRFVYEVRNTAGFTSSAAVTITTTEPPATTEPGPGDPTDPTDPTEPGPIDPTDPTEPGPTDPDGPPAAVPAISSVAPGTARASIDGQPAALGVTAVAGGVRATGAGLDLTLTSTLPPAGSSPLRLDGAGALTVAGPGFAPGSTVALWLSGGPQLLGRGTVGGDGRLALTVSLRGTGVGACARTLHLAGSRADGREVAASLGADVVPDPYPFTDVVRANVHAAAVACAQARGTVHGVSPGVFAPARTVTRGQVAAIVARSHGLSGEGDGGFTDTAGSVHAGPIAAVTRAGWMRGHTDGSFRPGIPVTRGQIAAVLAASLDLDTSDPTSRFTDTAGSVHAGAIAALERHGIVSGGADGRYRPGDPVTRAQAASMLTRAG
ncbi:S8 family serine peptidase [Egicoccus halophilus]|uniref:SLH domain-containing protein n=1 Tax=Egicoccus halophilus TaxID=1670830 RepID=A0A8J3A7F9_9ACTN|nr:S8 family serine peptidase [Egicoccus halophilus]GGI02609.1 hypothetical protein GCM10011354_00940 [Egicoccus halophilus]